MSKKRVIIIIAIVSVVLLLAGSILFIIKKGNKKMEIKCMSYNILGVEGYEGYLPVEIRAQYLQT